MAPQSHIIPVCNNAPPLRRIQQEQVSGALLLKEKNST